MLVATTGSTTIFGLSAVQSAVAINGVLGATIASGTAGIGAYREGKNPEQNEDATGNLYNIAIGALIGIAGAFAGAYRVGRSALTNDRGHFDRRSALLVSELTGFVARK